MPNLTQNTLKMLIQEEFDSMSAFAKQCGVSQSLVWRDCHGRQVSDKRFSAYLGILSPESRMRLIRARLHDILPMEFEQLVEVAPAPRLRDAPSNLLLMSPDAQSALEKLAGEMLRDPELHEWILQLIVRICPLRRPVIGKTAVFSSKKKRTTPRKQAK